MTEAYGFTTTLRPGAERAYETFHAAIPAALDTAMRDAGVLEWRIRRSGLVLRHDVVVVDRATMEATLDADPVNAKWQLEVAPFLADDDAPVDAAAAGGASAVGDSTLVWDFAWPTR
ncbi:L-rhamnose mutarotase [Agromyces sp. NPDC056379]|uniref:L-rhamnose mutarotase n=1 Tax=unclassified Agromyces TaxID=2639701 RepID=UPI0035E26631